MIATGTAPTHRPLPPRWSFGDLLLVASWSVLAVLLQSVGAAGLLLLLGGRDVEAMLVDHPVIASAVLGGAIYGIFLVVIYLRIVRRADVGWRDIGFRRPPILLLALTPLIAVGQLTAVAVTNLVLVSLIGEFDNPQVAALTGGQGFSWLNYGLTLLLAGAVAPLVEEVIFRGLIYGWLRARMPIVVAVIASAAIFAAAHVIPLLLPALFVVGVILAIVYEYSGSLWTVIALHAIQNSIATTLIFLLLAFPQMATP
ncbi:MAG TPA: type II CAAX endopeptidase family protein [Herpetosiphonaceae bacterium]|nr:type II CAAX endopeptidase family protein [Herpetosiphonaceae bacterium]